MAVELGGSCSYNSRSCHSALGWHQNVHTRGGAIQCAVHYNASACRLESVEDETFFRSNQRNLVDPDLKRISFRDLSWAHLYKPLFVLFGFG